MRSAKDHEREPSRSIRKAANDWKAPQRTYSALGVIGVVATLVFLWLWGPTGFYVALGSGVVVWPLVILGRRRSRADHTSIVPPSSTPSTAPSVAGSPSRCWWPAW